MAAWMLLSIGAAAAFTAVGHLAERAATLLRRPTRWLWLGVMVLTAGWPFARVLLHGGVAASVGEAAATPIVLSRSAAAIAASPGPPDALLLGAWLAASALLVVVLLLSAEILKEDRRRWRVAMVAGEPVHVSGRIGPAVVGMFNARIVIPQWVLELDSSAQRLVILHEREHVRAGDNRFLGAGLLLLTILPWCLPLWWQYRRMRDAIETDCDQRIVHGGASARAYAHALVTVADRRRRVLFPVSAMAHSRSALAARIDRVTSAGSPRRVSAAVGITGLAAAAAVAAAAIPVPAPPSVTELANGARRPAADRPPGALPGDPGQARIAAEIATHHGAAIAAGLPPGSVIWFIADRNGNVARTGIEQRSERYVIAMIRSRYPSETSSYAFAWGDVSTGSGSSRVVWMLPPR
jgi:bla regulator protein blaR1